MRFFPLHLKRYIDRIKGKKLDKQGWEGLCMTVTPCSLEMDECSGFAVLGFKELCYVGGDSVLVLVFVILRQES